MKILVVGASGATGKLLVEQLLNRGQSVSIIVRTTSALPESILSHENITIIQASILELSDTEMAKHVKGCDAVASCLGHTISFKGIFGYPRRLVTDATRRLCNAIKSNNPENPVKFVLMNTSGNSNHDLSEKISFAQKCVIGLVRLLVPPQLDNENAADYLRTEIGQHDKMIEWVAVRPDGLINEKEVTAYTIYPSPIRSAIFDAGTISRINVGHFMAELITNNETWVNWKGQMPVIYSKTL
ncbi:MAG: NAD(P)H-binding protein [Gammaproteobacteria bacterium]|nr:NAD(P)H-binding protein [Gammaproteobacteria bacterium]